jgi:IS5 family transposase
MVCDPAENSIGSAGVRMVESVPILDTSTLLELEVPVEEKIFSIYERHTDIIVKGGRDVQFGHKVQLSGGKSNLILTCEIVEGNPKDSELYKGTIEGVKKEYGKTPESSAADGGYASGANIKQGQEAGIITVINHSPIYKYTPF